MRQTALSPMQTFLTKAVVAGLLGVMGLWSGLAQAQSLDACVSGLRKEVLAQGITAKTFDSATKGVESDPDVLKAFDFQPEFRIAIWDYVAGLVDQERVDDGRAMQKKWSEVLQQAEQQYGVDARVIVAVWGVESNYGRIQGKREIIRSLVTLVTARAATARMLASQSGTIAAATASRSGRSARLAATTPTMAAANRASQAIRTTIIARPWARVRTSRQSTGLAQTCRRRAS